MATLHVRRVPDELYARLREEARANRRSLNAETIELLRRALQPEHRLSMSELLERAAATRARHRRRRGSPTAAELIREDRER